MRAKLKSFARGIHPPENKELTAREPIKTAPPPRQVRLLLQQNLGCPNEPLVKAGDRVVEGQKIAASAKFISAPLHASISGQVTSVDKEAIVIAAAEGVSTEAHYVGQWSYEEFTPEQIRQAVRSAGIVGLGGAAFPTHVKLTPPAGKQIETVIINGCECEPYITCDHRLMVERAGDVIYGARAIAKAVGASKIIIAIENNKQDAIKELGARNTENGTQGGSVEVLQTKYPQGGEKMLIKSLTGKEVPSGGLPSDIGVVVQNVGTAVAIAEAVRLGKPLIERVVTVTGTGVKKPQNLKARLGTSFRELIEQCGGLTADAVKVLMGGPMTGIAVPELDLPLLKGNNCLLVMNKKEAVAYEEKDCIRCGRCIKSCPVGLTPNFLAEFAKLKNWDAAADYRVADCIECGCCAYVCPSRIYLVQYFKLAKKELLLKQAVCK
ncbi:MAG: electron transport complex subunit RsxC [Candidatus Margulisiibacteriota bacterium]